MANAEMPMPEEKKEKDMLKGIQRQTVLIKTPENRSFEEVHFLMRSDLPPKESAENDLVREANRILEEIGFSNAKRRKKGMRPLLAFLMGILLGGSTVGTFWILFAVFL